MRRGARYCILGLSSCPWCGRPEAECVHPKTEPCATCGKPMFECDCEPPRPSRYYRHVVIDAQRINKDVGIIVEEVVQHLGALMGREVAVSLETRDSGSATSWSLVVTARTGDQELMRPQQRLGMLQHSIGGPLSET